MGQKVNPIGFELESFVTGSQNGTLKKTMLFFYTKISKFVNISNRLKEAAVSKVEIERAANRVNITVHTAKPGMVIGKGGPEVENLRKYLSDLTGKRVHINILEIKRADLDAKLVAENIARQLRKPCIIPSCSKTSDPTHNACWCKRN